MTEDQKRAEEEFVGARIEADARVRALLAQLPQSIALAVAARLGLGRGRDELDA